MKRLLSASSNRGVKLNSPKGDGGSILLSESARNPRLAILTNMSR